MEERNAELLAVPYFHVVFTLPARIAAIGYQNKAGATQLKNIAEPVRVLRDYEILRSGQRRHQGETLVHHADPKAVRVARARNRDRVRALPFWPIK